MRITDCYLLDMDEENDRFKDHRKCEICKNQTKHMMVINNYHDHSTFYCIHHMFDPLKLRILPFFTVDIPKDMRMLICNFMICEERVDFNLYHYIIVKEDQKYESFEQYITERYSYYHDL